MGLTIRAEAAPNMKEREVGGEPQLLSLSLIPSAGNEGHEAGIVNGAQKIFNVLTSWGPGEGIIVTGSTPVTAQVHRGPFKTPYRNLRDEPSRDIESLQLITLPNTTSYFDIDNPSWLTGTALHHTVVTSREANACIDNRRAAGFIDG